MNELSSRRGFLRAALGTGVVAGSWAGTGGAGRTSATTDAQNAVATDSNWPMFQHDETHSASAGTTGPKNPVEPAWTVETDDSLVSQPIVSDATVFQTSRDSRIYTVSAETGEEEWTISANSSLERSPAVRDGFVCVPTANDMLALSTGVGDGVWSIGIGSPISELTLPETGIKADNSVLFAERSNDGVTVAEVDLTSGSRTWSHTESFSHTDVNHVSVSSPLVLGRTLYLVYNVSGSASFSMYDDTFLLAISMDSGAKRWKKRFGGGGARIGVSANTERGAVYVAQRGNVIEKDAETGENNWQFSNISKIHVRPIFYSGRVCVLTNQPALHVFDPSIGTRRQQYELAGNPASPPVIADDVLYYGSSDNNVYAYDLSSGELLWQFSTGNSVTAAPTVLDGTLYVASTDNTLYALQEAGDLSPGDVTGDGAPAQDIDEDGLYEDVNGDGGFTIIDVQALFTNLDSEVVQNNVSKFDFNGDGKVDINDVQALYARLKE